MVSTEEDEEIAAQGRLWGEKTGHGVYIAMCLNVLLWALMIFVTKAILMGNLSCCKVKRELWGLNILIRDDDY